MRLIHVENAIKSSRNSLLKSWNTKSLKITGKCFGQSRGYFWWGSEKALFTTKTNLGHFSQTKFSALNYFNESAFIIKCNPSSVKVISFHLILLFFTYKLYNTLWKLGKRAIFSLLYHLSELEERSQSTHRESILFHDNSDTLLP